MTPEFFQNMSFYYVNYGSSIISSKVSQIISVMTKHELECKNKLTLNYHFSGNTSLHVFITEIIWWTFDVIIDVVERLCYCFFAAFVVDIGRWSGIHNLWLKLSLELLRRQIKWFLKLLEMNLKKPSYSTKRYVNPNSNQIHHTPYINI